MTLPEQRGLDGIVIRAEVDGEFVDRGLTDLPWEVVDHWLRRRASDHPQPLSYLMEVVRNLHRDLRDLADKHDLKGDYKYHLKGG